MPVTVCEYETGIILKAFSNSWTLEEMVSVREDEIRIAETYGALVDVIVDMSNVKRLPFNIGQAVQTFLQLDWSYIGMWVVITQNGFIRKVTIQIVQRSPIRDRVYFVGSVEEARNVIHRKRHMIPTLSDENTAHI